MISVAILLPSPGRWPSAHACGGIVLITLIEVGNPAHHDGTILTRALDCIDGERQPSISKPVLVPLFFNMDAM